MAEKDAQLYTYSAQLQSLAGSLIVRGSPDLHCSLE